jgi:chromosome segregation ATPase
MSLHDLVKKLQADMRTVQQSINEVNIEAIQKLKKEVHDLQETVGGAQTKIETFAEDLENTRKENENLKEELLAFKEANKQGNIKMQKIFMENSHLKSLLHVEGEKNEVLLNEKQKNAIIVSTLKPSKQGPIETVKAAFQSVLDSSSQETDEIMKNVDSAKVISKDSPNVYLVKLKAKGRAHVMNKLMSSKPKSNSFKIRNHVTKETRVKKEVLK